MSSPFFNSDDAMALQSEVPLPAFPTGIKCSPPSVSNVLLFVFMELYPLLELNEKKKKEEKKSTMINFFSVMLPAKKLALFLLIRKVEQSSILHQWSD